MVNVESGQAGFYLKVTGTPAWLYLLALHVASFELVQIP